MSDRSIKPDLLCLAALLALLGAAAGVWALRLGVLGTVLGLSIAGLKALLIASIFMDLRASSPLVRVFSLAGLYWGAILMVLTLADVLTRG